jgi:hypothetical protein
MHRGVAIAMVLALCLPVTVAGPAGAQAELGQPAVTPEGFDSTVFQIELYANGSARWTIRHRRPITNGSDRDAFEDFAATFRTNDTDLYEQFKLRADRLTASVGNQTGRQMAAEGFSKGAAVDELVPRGVISMSFTWTNLARTEGERVIFGDIFGGGFYIAQNQRLVVSTGDELAFQAAEPAPDAVSGSSLADSDSVTWFGEAQFADQRPRVVVAPPGASTTTTGATTTAPPGDGEGPGMVTFGVLLLAAIGLAGALAWRAGAFDSDGSDHGGAAGAESDAGDGAGAAVAVEQAPEPELLTDEDRVVQLIEDHGGRMKQVNIVDETGWSKSKVSMLLSDMEEEGAISKLRVGRENIISLSGNEPDAAGSPFEDDE